MAEQVIATVVGPGTVVRGEIRCAGDLIVHGRIEGAVSCGGALRLEPGGTIEAEIRARSASLAGRIRGDVNVVEAAELASSCRMLGDLRAAHVTIAPGAAVRGRVELGDVGSDEDAAWAAFDDAPDEGAAADAMPTPSPADPASPTAVGEGERSAPAARAAEPIAHEAPSDEQGAGLWNGGWTLDDSPLVYEHVEAGEEATPAPDQRRSGPPPIPASALALGVRSSIVIKR